MKYAKLKSFRSLVLLASASSISHLLSSQRHIVHLQTSHHTPEAPLAACPRAHPCWIICIQVHESHMHEVLLLAIHPKVSVASAVVLRQAVNQLINWSINQWSKVSPYCGYAYVHTYTQLSKFVCARCGSCQLAAAVWNLRFCFSPPYPTLSWPEYPFAWVILWLNSIRSCNSHQ